MTEQIDLINESFKGAKFVVSCFNSIEEVDTKVLNRKNKTLSSVIYGKIHIGMKKRIHLLLIRCGRIILLLVEN
jgi:hypothetical protein